MQFISQFSLTRLVRFPPPTNSNIRDHLHIMEPPSHTSLPEPILAQIFGLLPFRDRVRLAQTCKRLNEVAETHHVFRDVMRRVYKSWQVPMAIRQRSQHLIFRHSEFLCDFVWQLRSAGLSYPIEKVWLETEGWEPNFPEDVGPLAQCLRSLDLPCDHHGVWDEVFDLTSLTSLSLWGGILVPGVETQSFRRLSRLQSLSLSMDSKGDTSLMASALEDISALTNLTELNLGDDPITPDLPSCLANLSQLRSLELGVSNVSPARLEKVFPLTTLPRKSHGMLGECVCVLLGTVSSSLLSR